MPQGLQKFAKADLASQMVYEFPELQGVMGKYYALLAIPPEDTSVAMAAAEHYSPLGPSDNVPSAPVSVAVALADKLSMLKRFWKIDEKPTGSKDPFALRRAALGVIRIILDGGFRINIKDILSSRDWEEGRFTPEPVLGIEFSHDELLEMLPGIKEKAIDEFKLKENHALDDLLAFFADRLKVYLRDQGIRHDVIEACFQLGGQDDLVLLVARVRALQDFLTSQDGANLLQGYKRANNILNAEEKKDGVEYSLPPEPRLAETPAEGALFDSLDDVEADLRAALTAEDFGAAMATLASLRAPIDAFFETTTVNAANSMVRRNRLCLLNRIRAVMNRVAIFSAIEG